MIGRLRLALLVLRARIVRWWVNPVPPPERIGKAKRNDYPPIPLELGFFLHADGSVYHRSREGAGVRRIERLPSRGQLVKLTKEQLVELLCDERTCDVHSLVLDEYRTVVDSAKRRARLLMLRKLLIGR